MKPFHFFGKIFIFVLLFFSASSLAFANHLPSPSGFVNDFAHVLTREQASSLESSLKSYEQQTTNEIAIATVKSLNGADITDFTVKAFEEWKIGKKGKDNGVLLLAAIDDKKMRIEVGYGLEPKLTDSRTGSIIRDTIAPQFRNNNYYQGFVDGTNAIEKTISSEAVPTQMTNFWDKISPRGIFDLGILIFVLFHFIIIYTSSFLARTKSILAGGIIGAILGLVAGIIVGTLLFEISLTVLFGGLGLLLDWYLSNKYTALKKAGKKTDWWSTGGGFFGGRSGGGFGGFGGGGSGGGGASGGW